MARDLTYAGPPFTSDKEEHRHLRVSLDRNHAGYVLDTFPIVRREDETQFNDRYRTRDLILAYMNALAAGDTETKVSV